MDLSQLFMLGTLIFILTLVHSFSNNYRVHTEFQTMLYAQGREGSCPSWEFKSIRAWVSWRQGRQENVSKNVNKIIVNSNKFYQEIKTS